MNPQLIRTFSALVLCVTCSLPVFSATVIGGSLKKFKTKIEASIAQTSSQVLIKVPKMTMNFPTLETGSMLFTYCSESVVEQPGARIIVRLRIDSKLSGSMYLSGDEILSTRCVKWAFDDIVSGEHTVQVEYASSDGSEVTQYYRTLTLQYFK